MQHPINSVCLLPQEKFATYLYVQYILKYIFNICKMLLAVKILAASFIEFSSFSEGVRKSFRFQGCLLL